MLFDAQTPRLGVVKVDGALRFDLGTGAADTELRLIARTILVSGYLEMGREDVNNQMQTFFSFFFS